MKLEEFELLCDEPIYIEGVGNIKIPTLRDIRKIGYKTYEMFCIYLSVDLHKYIDITGLREQYDKLSDDGKKVNTLYNLIINNKEFAQIYYLIFSFFISENITFNEDTASFEFYKTDIIKEKVNETIKSTESKAGRFFRLLFKKIDFLNLFNHKSDTIEIEKIHSKENTIMIGVINNDNFDLVRDYLLQINRIKINETDDRPVKYKNEMARKLAERMAKAEKSKQEKDNMDFGKMVSKYCADNKNGINISNVWDITIYQFYDQFVQHNHIRQSDIQDMVYANTVSFSDLKAYDSQLWLK